MTRQAKDERPRTLRGLATVAMLKVNFDAGRDHIAMFEPFVVDAVKHYASADFVAEDIQREVERRHELRIPVNTLTTLLRRLVRGDGLLRREGGRYFREANSVPVSDLIADRRVIEVRQATLGRALCDAGQARGVDIPAVDDALALVLDFLGSYHVAMALDEDPIPGDSEARGNSDRHKRLLVTAQFLADVVAENGELASVLQEMLEGFVLQNALLLKDISTAARQFDDLLVFADSGVLFGVLGLRGPAAETAAVELIGLLRETGGLLNVFENTIQEMRRVLAVYEDRIGTSRGRQSLYPTELTRHLLSIRATPSDIRMRASLLDRDLKQLGFNIREVPERQPRWTLDERALGKALADGARGENEPRVVHDVDCVAGVLLYRRGQTSTSLDNAIAVFATTSGMTVRNTKTWYADQGGRGVAPIIHYLALSNAAWLKRPASAAKLKLHELVALCAAALRPSDAAWKRFVDHLRSLEASNELTSDEVTAIIASDLTERFLVDDDIDEDSDAASLSEVVERVKASYNATSVAELQTVRTQAETATADAAAVRAHLAHRARGIARPASWAVMAIAAILCLIGTVLSIVGTATGGRPSTLWICLAVGPLALAGLLGVVGGFHLKAWRTNVESRLTDVVLRWLHGPAPDAPLNGSESEPE